MNDAYAVRFAPITFLFWVHGLMNPVAMSSKPYLEPVVSGVILKKRDVARRRALGIWRDALYSLDDLRDHGYSDATLRAARRRGLPVRYIHRRGHVLGADWIDYVLTHADCPNAPATAPWEENPDDGDTNKEGTANEP